MEKSKYSEFQCPTCGWWPDSNDYKSENLIDITPPEISDWKAREFGVQSFDWSETWKCPHCGTEWTFDNSNC